VAAVGSNVQAYKLVIPAHCAQCSSCVPTMVCHLVVVVGLMHRWPGRCV